MRSLEDVKTWLRIGFVGSVETAAAPWWRALRDYCPQARVAVVRRPVEEVVESLMRLDMRGSGAFDRKSLTDKMRRLDAKLDQIEARMPGVLSVRFDDLKEEQTCARLFEHCLIVPHDYARWKAMAQTNLAASMPALVRYALAFSSALNKLERSAKQEVLFGFAKRRMRHSDELTIGTEPFTDFLRDGVSLFAEHAAEVGEQPNSYLGKNIPLMETLEGLGALFVTTARSNGRMFGYLITILSPSLESMKITTAINTLFYASPLFPGLGLKLQRTALETLRRGKANELILRAGVRGDGERTSALYRRMGASPAGELFRLDLGSH